MTTNPGINSDNKSGNIGNTGEKASSLQIVGGNPADILARYAGSAYTPAELLERVTGWVAICADKQASFISSQPLRLYRRKTDTVQTARKGIRSVSAGKTAKLQDSAVVGQKTAIWAEQAGEIEEIVDAPVLKMLHNPNQYTNGTDFAYISAWMRSTTGNSYILIETDNQGNVVSMTPLYPQYIRPVVEKGNVVKYMYGSNSKAIELKKENVFHQVYRPSRANLLIGECPLHSVMAAADILKTSDARELSFQENNARPDMVIQVPAESTPQQMADTEKKFNSQFRGTKNAGKFAVIRDSIITPLGFSPKDLEGINLRREMKQEIFAAYGISESEFSTNDANLASSKTGNLQFYRNIKPLLIKNAEEFTDKLIPFFYPDAEPGEYFFAYDDIIPAESKPTLTAAEKLTLGVMTLNEMRAELGYGPVEGGDVIRFNGQTLDSIDGTKVTQDSGAAKSANIETQVSYTMATPAFQYSGPATLNILSGGASETKTEAKMADKLAEPSPSDTGCMTVMTSEERVAQRDSIWASGEILDHKTETGQGLVDCQALSADLYENIKVFTSSVLTLDKAEEAYNVYQASVEQSLRKFALPSYERGIQDGNTRLKNLCMVTEAVQPNTNSFGEYVDNTAKTVTNSMRANIVSMVEEKLAAGQSIEDITSQLCKEMLDTAGEALQVASKTVIGQVYMMGQADSWAANGIKEVTVMPSPALPVVCRSMIEATDKTTALPIENVLKSVPHGPGCRCDIYPSKGTTEQSMVPGESATN